MGRYRKKPVIVEAFKWTGGIDQEEDPEWIVSALKANEARILNGCTPDVVLQIDTLEGKMIALQGDYIIRGVKGEIYPCRNDIFAATYEKVE